MVRYYEDEDKSLLCGYIKKLETGTYRVQGKKRTWEMLTDIQKLSFALIAAAEVFKIVKISDVVEAAGIKKMKTADIIVAARNAKRTVPDYKLVIMRQNPLENYNLLQDGVFTCCKFE